MDDPRRLALAETLAVRYPAEPAGHLLLGQARLWGGDFSGAIRQFRQVVAMDSAGLRGAHAGCRACDALWDLGTAYTLADSLGAAERVAREWARAQPRSSQPWIALGYALEAAGRYAEALAAVDSATARQPGDLGIDIRTGVLLRAGDFEAYEQLTRELFRVGGPEAKKQLLWSLALGLRTQGRMEEALKAARQLVRLSGQPLASPVEVTMNRVAEAQALFDAGRAREAAALFEEIASVDIAAESTARNARHRAWNLTHAADAYALLGDTARLRALADSVERLGARSAFARDQRLHHHIRGLRLRLQGHSAEAVTEFRRALFSPVSGNTRTNLELARALLEDRRPAEAVPVLEAALRGPVGASGYYVTRTELHELLARALEEAGRVEEAVPHHRWVEGAWRRGEGEFRLRAEAASRRIGMDPPAR
jgi:tetratricopeptide (TPR) repeat protein